MWLRVENLSSKSMLPRYVIIIKGDSLAKMTEEALHYTYFLLGRALAQHRLQGKNGEYEGFAVSILALLQKYRHLYTTLPEAPAPEPACGQGEQGAF